MISKTSPLTTGLSLWALGLVLGLTVGIVPLLTARLSTEAVDPFDFWLSYAAWEGGLFFSAMFIGFLRSERTWRWGIAVSFGLPTAAITETVVDVVLGTARHTLWPLTIILTVFIAVPPAFAGAYFGGLAKRTYKKLTEGNGKSEK
jgi:hypothetical protein